MKKSLWLLVLMSFACRPVIAIGWEELLILVVLFVFLLGPPLYRLIRKVENFWRQNRKDK
ncbi:MAG TPA: hypothetical protein VK880_03470 [Anaerolineales bacterium]|nr:hypothetical protein [Anaerolineales bacterium]